MVNTSGAQLLLANSNRQTMNRDAARYYNGLVGEIFAQTNIIIVPTEGTRTYSRQLELYNLYRAGKGNPAWSPNSPYAYHLSGRAVDVGSGVGYVNTNAARIWRAKAGKYGFRETVAGEPWHFEWRQEWASISLEVAESAKPIPIPAKENHVADTFLIKRNSNGTIAALAVPGVGLHEFAGEAEYREVAFVHNAVGSKLNNDIRWPDDLNVITGFTEQQYINTVEFYKK